jgi:hypothetical protein
VRTIIHIERVKTLIWPHLGIKMNAKTTSRKHEDATPVRIQLACKDRKYKNKATTEVFDCATK